MVACSHGNDRIVFSLPFAGSAVNSLTPGVQPLSGGWFAPHDFGLSSATAYTKNTRRLHGGKVGTAASSYGYVYDVFRGGTTTGPRSQPGSRPAGSSRTPATTCASAAR